LTGNFIKSCDDRGIAATGVVKKQTGNLLNPVNTGLVQEGKLNQWRQVVVFCRKQEQSRDEARVVGA
jgi:hypothetical protein